jgi:hydroxymethylpyrimidine/phosphomethylpyrimidine kinase
MPNKNRPNVLSIAGFDPSAGAGVLADIKTFEACSVYGMGVVSALTYQNDIAFEKVEWMQLSQIIEQVEVLQKRFQFEYIKIGLIENLEILDQLISYLKLVPTAEFITHNSELITHNSQLLTPKLIWDPILKASAGFEFYNIENRNLLEKICSQIYLITPNVPEAMQLGTYNDFEKNSRYLSEFCNVYLKGGHNSEKKGNDFLYTTEGKQILFQSETEEIFQKHGSGCVLSSAITANLAKGLTLEIACAEAKKYITKFLLSDDSLLGHHSNITH